jgi:hypothetical protein
MKDSFSTEAEFERVPSVGFKRQKPGFIRFVAEECKHGFHMLYAEYTDGNTEVVNNMVGGLPPWIEKGAIA